MSVGTISGKEAFEFFRGMFGNMPLSQVQQIYEPVGRTPKKKLAMQKKDEIKLHRKIKNKRRITKNSRRMNRHA